LLGVVNWIKGLQANRVGVALTFELRSQLVAKLHALSVGYYDRHQVGSLVSRVAYDSEVLHTLLQQLTGGFLLQVVQVLAVGFMLFTLNPKLALFTLIPAPLVVGGVCSSGAAFIPTTTVTGTQAANRPGLSRECSPAFE
jgi:ATP-binding cassette subfamily B protein